MTLHLDTLLGFSLAPGSLRFILPWILVSLAVVTTFLQYRRLRARLGDARGMAVYFGAFFVLFLVVPAAALLVLEDEPLRALSSLGVQAGRAGTGLLLSAIAFPVTLVICFFASKEPAMREQYPFSRDACASDGAFVLYEASYLLFYYSAWEFLYRGLLFFPLLHAVGFLGAAALTTALSMLHHIGHPDSEIAGALLGGLLFATVCALTDSIFYGLAIHAMMGIGNDSFIYARFFRGRPVTRRRPSPRPRGGER